ncbi:peptidoglycan-binding protein [Streptomyces broussonetiae]|uniref:Peptidoglycan-binding protein n=1 Tax=Streptomyces broussonetiae TaxID=2686304 RepID=A0ABV5E857_9ACTN
MEPPVFQDIDPAGDCDCPGCDRLRRALPAAPAYGHHGARLRTVAVAAAATAALGAAHAVPAAAHAPERPGVPAGDEPDAPQDRPDTPQGNRAPLYGPTGRPAAVAQLPTITRAEIIDRARGWVAAKVPYSLTAYWSDGYRQDCSGYVSMAWKLPGNEWTGSLGQVAVRIAKADLRPGDILLFHNQADPHKGSHVVIFGGWTDTARTSYVAYEQTRPHTRSQTTPYAYWSDSDRYVPYRYKGVTEAAAGPPGGGGKSSVGAGTPYPGAARFGPGADNGYVTLLGRMLVERGAGRHYATGPGPRWTEADRRATRAFQLAQGWTGRDADGLPGPGTWSLLTTGKGRDISAGPVPGAPPTGAVPAYPGRGAFRPGAENRHVTLLGRQLVKKGFGKHYTSGPGPRWGEADRRNVEAFQRAQGWRGGAADGYPGPETWRRLFL